MPPTICVGSIFQPRPAIARRAPPSTCFAPRWGGDAVLTLGPFTNVAEALRADPSLAGHAGPVVSMAGAIDVPGNAPGGVAEFNVWIDPTAAKEVLDALSVTLVPLDATNRVPTTTFFLDALHRHRTTRETRAAYALLKDNPQIPVGQYFFWDPLAATLFTQPELASFEDATVLVTVSADAGNGWISRWDRGVAVRIASAVTDPLAFERGFLSTLACEVVTDVRPAPDATITFDGTTCAFRTQGVLASGSRTFVFRNAANRTRGRRGRRVRERHDLCDLLAVLGPPGSSIREAPPSVTVLASTQAEGGATSYLAVDATTPNVAAVCGYQHGRSIRVWPGGAATVHR
jgi:Inosine-uridine preferring nucleoside hydrolase